MQDSYTPAEQAQQAQHRKEWSDALRSGKYTQAHGYLQRGDAFCCLGVACDISGLGEFDDDSYFVLGGDYPEHTREDTSLPYPVQEYFGIDREGTVREDARDDIGTPSLISANDNLNWDFNRIASIIDADVLDGPEA